MPAGRFVALAAGLSAIMTQTDGRELMRGVARQCGRGLAYAALLTLFLNLLQLVLPLYMMQVYERVMNSRSIDTLVLLTIVSVGGLLVSAVLDFIRSRTYLITAEIFASRLNVATLRAAVSSSLRPAARNAAQAVRDLNDLRLFITGSAVAVPFDAAWAPVFLGVLFMLHPAYGVLALAACAILIGLSIVTEIATKRPLAEANQATVKAFTDVGNAMRHAEVIEAMGMLNAFTRRWQISQQRMLERLNRGNARAKAIAAASKSARMILQIAMIATGAVLVIDRAASPGSIIAASIIMGRLLAPFEQLIEGWRQWIFAATAYKRLSEVLSSHDSGRQRIALPRPDGKLVVDRMSFVPPGTEKPVLKGISFTLEPGEVLGVIGPSAAGKSTLARLLVGVWEPTAGGVYLDGHNVFLWERENFGRYVGYVPQSISLLDGTIRENIARLADVPPEEVINAAKKADIHEMIGRLPFGYDTEIGEGGFSLSGGQRQRVALARALIGDPRLLVLDEPNANLDAMGEQALLQAILEAKRAGTTVVLIAHRPSIISIVDKILVLRDGMVDQFGPRTDIIKMVTPDSGPARDVERLKASGGVTRLIQS